MKKAELIEYINELEKERTKHIEQEHVYLYQIKKLQTIIAGFLVLADKYNISNEDVHDAMYLRSWIPLPPDEYKQKVESFLNDTNHWKNITEKINHEIKQN